MRHDEDDLLALSGIQHFAYCPRQWALIHIEKQWTENLRTVEGRLLHERVDNPDLFEARGGILSTRSVPLVSYTLGLYGVADVVEFHAVENEGVVLNGRPGHWQPVPVEYKRGKPKRDTIDEVQLCAQAICIEEMLGVNVPYGYLYYGQTRHRMRVNLKQSLRDEVARLAQRMHALYQEQVTPPPTATKGCKSCSLVGICLPQLGKKHDSVNSYLKSYLEQLQ